MADKKQGKKTVMKRWKEKFIQFLSAFSYFNTKKFYKLLFIDIIYLGLLALFGTFLDARSYTPVKAFVVLIISLIFTAFVYAGTRFYFYRIIGQEQEIKIILKHFLAFLYTGIINVIIFSILYFLIRKAIVTDYKETFNLIARYLMYFVSYFIVLHVHKNFFVDHNRKAYVAVLKSYKQLFKVNEYRFVLHDLLIFACGYLLYNLIAFIFRVFLIWMQLDMAILNTIYNPLSTVIFFVIAIMILTVNKIIVYDVNLTLNPKATHATLEKSASNGENQ